MSFMLQCSPIVFPPPTRNLHEKFHHVFFPELKGRKEQKISQISPQQEGVLEQTIFFRKANYKLFFRIVFFGSIRDTLNDDLVVELE